MKQKTALAQLRDKLLKAETNEKTDFAKGYMQCLKDIALSIELQMFPIEQNQMEEMYIEGLKDEGIYHKHFISNATESFNDNFEQHDHTTSNSTGAIQV